MTDEQIESLIREYIDKTVHMSLATATSEGKPWVCEVHFGYDKALNLYFVSLQSTRHCQEIAANPHVAGNIVKQHELGESPHGIYFEGTAELVKEPSEAEMMEVYGARLGWDQAVLAERLAESNGHGMYKISVENWAIFGKFGLEKNQKHTLAWGSK